jgi:hypothetical protein
VNFPFICSNIPALSAYREHIPQLIPYGSSDDFIDRSHHHHDLVNRHGISVLQMTTYMFCLSYSHSCTILIHTLCDKLRVTRQVPLVERKLPTFPGNSCSLRFLMVFVLVDLIFIYNHNRNSFVLKILNSLFWFEIILVFIFYARNGHKCNLDWSQR